MIAAVQKNPPTAAHAVGPGAIVAPGKRFASLLPITDGDTAAPEDRQDKAPGGKDLPEDAAADGVSGVPVPVVLPSAVSNDAIRAMPTEIARAIVPPTPPQTVPVAAPPVIAAVPATSSQAPKTDVVAAQPTAPQPFAPAPPSPPSGEIEAVRVTNTLAPTTAVKPLSTGTAQLPVTDRPIARTDTPQSPARAVAAIVTQQAIAVMADRPPPLVQGLIATVRSAAERPALPSPPSAERERIAEPRSEALTTLSVAATPIEAHRNILDLRQEHWPQRMVDHIAALRDAADANDTRIRLVPDALGAIDVHLRREGETVHVAFGADRAETRALLDEARPQLAELGESKGLRFTQSGAGHDGTQQGRHAPAPRLTPAPARSIPEPDPTDGEDAARVA